MKLYKKICVILSMFVVLTFTLTGCTHFDCSGYIQAMLDSIYKGDHAAYARLTKLSEDRLAENYEEGINAEIETLISYMNIAENSSFVNENVRGNARDMFKRIYRHASYSVGEADKKGNVTVAIQPINIFQLAGSELMTYNNDFYTRNDKGEFASMDDEAFYSAYIQGVIDILNKYVDQIGYNETQNVTVRVKANSQNVYSIKDTEFLELDKYIIDYEQ